MKIPDSKDNLPKKPEIQNITTENKLIKKKINSKKRCILALAISAILIVSLIIVICLVVLKERKKRDQNLPQINEASKEKDTLENQESSETKEKTPQTENKKTNTIETTFLMEEGKETKLFNPKLLGIEQEQYQIEIAEISGGKRNLNSELTIIKNETFIPKNSGLFSVLFSFDIELKSIFGIFKNCERLIDVNFSGLKNNLIENITSAFEKCSNLKSVDLTNINTSNLTSTENLFNGCTNLISVNLTQFNTTKIENMQNMFKDCSSITNIDLSNFKSNNSFSCFNMFDGCIKLKTLDISGFSDVKEEIFGAKLDLGKVQIKIKFGISTFLTKFNFTNNILAPKKTCIKGSNEKCLSCQEDSEFCQECNDGYYLPSDALYPSTCMKCPVNCLSCQGTQKWATCNKCDEKKAILLYERCFEKCIVGEGASCKSCREREAIPYCNDCNEGYFIREDQPLSKSCDKCPDGCKICHGNKEKNYCEKCEGENYELKDGICVKKLLLPERIDLVKNGKLLPGVVDIINKNNKKSQQNDNIQYYNSGKFSAPRTSYWWKSFTESTNNLFVTFNFSQILNGNELPEGYFAVIKCSTKFTTSPSSYEYSAVQEFFQECGGDFNYCASMFGDIYMRLENKPHNGNIYSGGVFNRGGTFWRLEGLTGRKRLAKGTTHVSYNLYVEIGVFQAVSGISVSETFNVYELYLEKEKPLTAPKEGEIESTHKK